MHHFTPTRCGIERNNYSFTASEPKKTQSTIPLAREAKCARRGASGSGSYRQTPQRSSEGQLPECRQFRKRTPGGWRRSHRSHNSVWVPQVRIFGPGTPNFSSFHSMGICATRQSPFRICSAFDVLRYLGFCLYGTKSFQRILIAVLHVNALFSRVDATDRAHLRAGRNAELNPKVYAKN
jgi:hypothetical protein